MRVCQKAPNSYFQSQFSTSRIIRIFLIEKKSDNLRSKLLYSKKRNICLILPDRKARAQLGKYFVSFLEEMRTT